MPTYVLRFHTSKENAERITDAVLESVVIETSATSVMEDESAGAWMAEIYTTDMPDMAAVSDCLDRNGLSEQLPNGEIEELDDIDWVAHALDGLAPVQVARYFVCGRHDLGRVSPYHIPIIVEASQAFGTGHHATTEGCLSLMHEYFKTQSPKTILDVGCGSGVLAIAAAKHKKSFVIGTEIDPPSAKIASFNVSANRVAHQVEIQTRGDLRQVGSAYNIAKFDMVIANILARPLVHLSDDICHSVKSDGAVILSGLLKHQQRYVSAAYRRFGFVVKKRFVKGEWVALMLAR